MKLRLIRWCLFLSVLPSLLVASCDEDSAVYPYVYRSPLKEGSGHLRVFVLGNSYALNATKHLNLLLTQTSIAPSSYSVYVAHSAGASLDYWWSRAQTGDSIDVLLRAGYKMQIEGHSLSDWLSHDWDVIVLQQNSANAIDYNTFNPSLRHLVDFIYSHCTNPSVTLAWHLAWSYADAYSKGNDNYGRWQQIAHAASLMTYYDGIQLIIPSGTAVQNARSAMEWGEGQLTCDGTHLENGVGCYVASCTWFEALFFPVFGVSVRGNIAVVNNSEDDDSSMIYPSNPVSYTNRDLSQQWAIAAVATPFKLSGL